MMSLIIDNGTELLYDMISIAFFPPHTQRHRETVVVWLWEREEWERTNGGRTQEGFPPYCLRWKRASECVLKHNWSCKLKIWDAVVPNETPFPSRPTHGFIDWSFSDFNFRKKKTKQKFPKRHHDEGDGALRLGVTDSWALGVSLNYVQFARYQELILMNYLINFDRAPFFMS